MGRITASHFPPQRFHKNSPGPMPKISLYGVGPQFPALKGPAWRCVFSAVRCTFGVTFPDRAAGQPSQMIGAVGAQTRPKFEFCARPKCTDWNKTRIFALVQPIAINATTLPPIKRRWPYGPGVRSQFSRFLALNAEVLQRGFAQSEHQRRPTSGRPSFVVEIDVEI